jgi:penicillin-binding protein 1A
LTIVRRAGLVALFVLAATLGTATGVFFAYSGDLPRISALDEYAPSTITRVYGEGREVIGEFAVQRRIVIQYGDIPPVLRQAILAAEDSGFFEHFGLSIPHIVATAVKDLIEMRKAGGASTLTQQLARKLFLTDEKTWERKVKEAILAIQIEKRYTKEEIFTMYCNQMYFGHGAYGVEAASRLYFGKSAKDLRIEEAALIAGILQGNVRQSPFVNMRAALRRRNYALDRMAEVGFIPGADAEAAKKKPVEVRGEPNQAPTIAPYFLEEVRKHLEARYGSKHLYENGLAVQTTLSPQLQRAANRAIENGLRRIERRRGYRPAKRRNLVDEKVALDTYRDSRWDRPIVEGDVVPAIVTAVEGATIALRAGRLSGVIDKEGYSWTGRQPQALAKRGDIVDVSVRSIEPDKAAFAASLEQTPSLEGALLAIENRTGRILAMVGGYSFDRSKFNRATQALRQVGSSFKAFVFTAAIDRGYTPASIIVDAPVSYPNGAGRPPYAPLNYDREFWGPITLRRAVEQSRNIPAIKMMDQLGPQQVVAYARRFGLTSPIPPYLPVALGAAEATLQEMTAAYAVFPNQGVRMTPFGVERVTDREGNALEENRPEAHDAIRADTAYVMTNLLRGVVLRGTAARAAALDWPIGGKTGTTDDYTDAWFLGFDPDITVGVWIGRDLKKTIGSGFTGTEVALPIWIDFFKDYIASRASRGTGPPGSGRDAPRPTFEPPGNIVFASIDRATGAPSDPSDPAAISEAFISGTQPVR